MPGAVVIAQLVELSFLTPENLGSNPAISNFFLIALIYCLHYKKTKITETRPIHKTDLKCRYLAPQSIT